MEILDISVEGKKFKIKKKIKEVREKLEKEGCI